MEVLKSKIPETTWPFNNWVTAFGRLAGLASIAFSEDMAPLASGKQA